MQEITRSRVKSEKVSGTCLLPHVGNENPKSRFVARSLVFLRKHREELYPAPAELRMESEVMYLGPEVRCPASCRLLPDGCGYMEMQSGRTKTTENPSMLNKALPSCYVVRGKLVDMKMW